MAHPYRPYRVGTSSYNSTDRTTYHSGKEKTSSLVSLCSSSFGACICLLLCPFRAHWEDAVQRSASPCQPLMYETDSGQVETGISVTHLAHGNPHWGTDKGYILQTEDVILNISLQE